MALQLVLDLFDGGRDCGGLLGTGGPVELRCLCRPPCRACQVSRSANDNSRTSVTMAGQHCWRRWNLLGESSGHFFGMGGLRGLQLTRRS